MRSTTGRRVTRALTAAGVAVAVAAGCQGGGGSSSTTKKAAQTTAFRTIPIPTTTTAPPANTGTGSGGQTSDTGTSASANPSEGTYKVQADDNTWFKIANKIGIDAAKLAAYNGKTLNDYVYVGDILKFPRNQGGSSSGGSNTTTASGPTDSSTGTTSATAQSDPNLYVVQPGDTTWYKIADKVHRDAAALAAFNDLTLNDYVHVGDRLKIPPAKP
jgi:LysM repeat protein